MNPEQAKHAIGVLTGALNRIRFNARKSSGDGNRSEVQEAFDAMTILKPILRDLLDDQEHLEKLAKWRATEHPIRERGYRADAPNAPEFVKAIAEHNAKGTIARCPHCLEQIREGATVDIILQETSYNAMTRRTSYSSRPHTVCEKCVNTRCKLCDLYRVAYGTSTEGFKDVSKVMTYNECLAYIEQNPLSKKDVNHFTIRREVKVKFHYTEG